MLWRRGFRTRLLLAVAAGYLTLFAIGAYDVMTYRRLLTRMSEAQQYAVGRLSLAKEIESHYSQQNLAWANLLLRGQDPVEYHRYLSVFYGNERQTLDLAERLLEQLGAHEAPHALTRQFVQSLHELRAQYRQALRIYNGSKQSQQATDQFLSAITRKPAEILAQIETLMLSEYEAAMQELQRNARRQEMSIALISVALLAVLLLFMLWFVDRNFARPMAHAIQTARQVAAGNIQERIQIARGDEFSAFAEAFNLMLERLARYNAELEVNVARLRAEVASREQAERALHSQREALAMANRELEAFSYSVSHDLRGPLRAIDGFARLLENACGDGLSEQGRHYLARVLRGAQRMRILIDALLDLARVSQAAIEPAAVDLSAMAREIVADLALAEPTRKVAVEIAPGLAARGDAQLLHVLLANLLGNAWKYTRGTPAARIEFASAEESGGTVFCVRDNGAGFDMKHAAQLFGPFQRLHAEHEFEGTGIGLATADRVVRRHGGRIWAEGWPGRGAIFRFTLPGTPQRGEAETAEETEAVSVARDAG